MAEKDEPQLVGDLPNPNTELPEPDDNTVPEAPILEVNFSEPLDRETQAYPELDDQGRWDVPKEPKTVED